jgi:DNA transformation protein
MADDSFTEYVLEQLSDLDGVSARRMFGGHGVYRGDAFFGIVMKGRLWFRVDDETRPRYEAAGSEPFQPNEKQRLKNYLEVPADVVENRDRLVDWARDAAEARR